MGELTASWLAARFGLDPVRIERLRRAGELYAVRAGTGEWRYPSWQFDRTGRPKPAVQRVLRAARERGIEGQRLTELFERRVGLVGGGRTVRDLLLEGREDQALAELRGMR